MESITLAHRYQVVVTLKDGFTDYDPDDDSPKKHPAFSRARQYLEQDNVETVEVYDRHAMRGAAELWRFSREGVVTEYREAQG